MRIFCVYRKKQREKGGEGERGGKAGVNVG